MKRISLLCLLLGCLLLSSQAATTDIAEQLRGKRIAVVPAMLYDEIARKEFPYSERVYTELATLPVALVTGKCDAILMERSTVPRLQEAHPEIVTWMKDVAQQRLAFGFQKNDKALCEEFNAFLEELKKSGELERLLTGWKTNFDTMPMPTEGDGSGGTLRFGTTCEDAPVSGIRNGQPAGHNIDIVYRFAAHKQMKVELQKMNFTGLITAIAAGKCDVIGDNIAITDERAKRILFSEPFDSEPIDLLTLKGSLPNDAHKPAEGDGLYRTINDVADKRFSVMVGTIYDAILKEKLPHSKHIYVDTASDLVVSLLSGKCDATLTEHSIAPLIIKEHPEIAVLQGDFYQQELAFGFSKKNAALCEKFSAFIRELKASGALDSINNGWGKDFDGMPDLVNTGDGSGGTLRFGTSMSGAPIATVRNGKPAGSNVDFVYRFANKYHMKVEVKTMNFAALIASIETGRCDIIGDNIAITPERSQRILFSEPYAFDPVDVLVLKSKMPAATASPTETNVKSAGWWERLKESFNNNLIKEKRYMLIVNGLWVTLIISLFSALLGTLLGAGICFLRMNRHPLSQGFARGYITIVRGMPMLVLLMMMYYVIFASVNISAVPVAILAFAINFAAYVSEMFRTAIESIPSGQTEAGIAMGFTKVKTFAYIVLPQAVRRVLPVYKGEFISLVKSTSIVGYIAVEDLTKASDIIRSRTFDAFFPLILVAIIYFFIAWLFTLLLDRLDVSTDPKRKRSKKGKS
jgi:polar amino acid transport system substrate-binding protein